VNNAAVGHFGSVLTAPLESIVNVFNVDVFGPIQLMQNVVPHMSKGGRIINIGSVASKLGLAEFPVYGAAKAAIDALTFSMSQEVRPDGCKSYQLMTESCTDFDKQLGREKGITINTIAPGPVTTDSFPARAPQALLDRFTMLTRAEERIGTVDDIADVALFLASEKSRWITGQWISVSGGVTGM
jgi:NAD(P)-dependent dehydrogenase (short-subunit alcohol dehydrogenase family)